MYTLYYSPGACSMAVHVLLNELKQPVKLEKVVVQKGEGQKPEFLKLNPRGQVPLLVEDGKTLREGAAIMTYLCDKHKSPLLPAAGWDRAQALQWLMFANSSLHPAYSKVFGLKRLPLDATTSEMLLGKYCEAINSLWTDVEQQLGSNEYICGSQMTAADILLTVIGDWSAGFPLIHIGPKAKALFGRVSKRPSYQEAMAAEKVEYKMAS